MPARYLIRRSQLQAVADIPPTADDATSHGVGCRLTANHRITLRELAIRPEHGEYIVGDPVTGRFVALPGIGVRVLEALRSGETIAQVTASTATADTELDVLDFVNAMLAAGFVKAIDGEPVGGRDEGPDPAPPLNRAAARLGRVVFSQHALTACALLLGLALVAMMLRPAVRPSFQDAFVDEHPAVSFALIFALSLTSGMAHELCHWWAARSFGVPARITFARRLYLPVMQTDVSGLWSVSPRQRYPVFLAGMAFDSVVLVTALSLRLAWSTGMINADPLLLRICGALVLLKLIGLSFQCLVFLRTDLYAVMITRLGTRNLTRTTRLLIKKTIGIASAADHTELAAAHPRDLAVSRWYSLCYLAGMIWAAWYVKFWLYPVITIVLTWVVSTLEHAPPSSPDWCQAVAISLTLSVNYAWVIVVYIRERIARQRGLTR